MSTILITGVNGFVGSALANRLCSNNDNYIVGLGFDVQKEAPVNQMLYGDIRDASFVRRVIADYEIEYVYHMAAQSIVRVCANDPLSAYHINVMGTVNLLEACRTVGKHIKSILVNTSDKAYGHVAPPYDEDTPLRPLFTYEATKACQDIVAQNFAHNYNMPIKVARCSNIYGPGDENKSRLIPNSIIQCLRGKPPVLHNGVHNYIREFIYIDDVVDAFHLISYQGQSGQVYCVGGTGHHRVLDIMNLIIQHIDPSLQPEIHDKDIAFKEIEAQWICADKLRALGWQPKVSLDEGIRRAIEYYKENLHV